MDAMKKAKKKAQKKKVIKAKVVSPASRVAALIKELQAANKLLLSRLKKVEAEIAALKCNSPKSTPPQWIPAPSPFPSWPNQPPIMWNTCTVKEEYDAHRSKATNA